MASRRNKTTKTTETSHKTLTAQQLKAIERKANQEISKDNIPPQWYEIAVGEVIHGLTFAQACISAGLKEGYATTSAYIEVRKNPRYSKCIATIQKEYAKSNVKQRDRWRARCEHRGYEALKAGDRATARGYDDMLGKSYGVYELDKDHTLAQTITDIMALVGVNAPKSIDSKVIETLEGETNEEDV